MTERNKRLPALVNLGVRGWVEANLRERLFPSMPAHTALRQACLVLRLLHDSALREPHVRRCGDGARAFVPAAAGAAQGNELLGVASFPKPTDKLRLDFSSLLGPLFYSWTAQLLLPTM